MKTFVQKLGRSLWAMTCGWIACNVVLNLATLAEMRGGWQGAGLVALIYGFYSGLVILVACLAIFLPVDLLLAEDSRLRYPPVAAIFGFVAGSCVPLALALYHAGLPHRWSLDGTTWSALPWVLSPGITGMVAAWVRTRNNPV